MIHISRPKVWVGKYLDQLIKSFTLWVSSISTTTDWRNALRHIPSLLICLLHPPAITNNLLLTPEKKQNDYNRIDSLFVQCVASRWQLIRSRPCRKRSLKRKKCCEIPQYAHSLRIILISVDRRDFLSYPGR
ncbi:hypothetical protein ATANTOWER_022178 [Ataeniobius toweri]|uniref:Uncharacterized protein n=1 Tax=Ataeniobius toweri TaxID=208326 RepID=A0ABU7AZX9_9TELE|nr:hypothetical protein [Ataeniobius toweri]